MGFLVRGAAEGHGHQSPWNSFPDRPLKAALLEMPTENRYLYNHPGLDRIIMEFSNIFTK